VVLSILRQAAEPLTSRDIALELLVSCPMDKRDQRLLRLMRKRVGVALRTQRANGVVQSDQGPGQFMLWEVKRQVLQTDTNEHQRPMAIPGRQSTP
jgi:hypothetical protein